MIFLLFVALLSLNISALECEHNGAPCSQVSITFGKNLKLNHDIAEGDVLFSCGPLNETTWNIKGVVILEEDSSTIFYDEGVPKVFTCLPEQD